MIVLYCLGALALMALAVWFGFSWGFESRGADSLSRIVDVLEDMDGELSTQTVWLEQIAINTRS